jgi:phosphotransferase family enzyme
MLPVPPLAAPERLTAMLRGAGVLERGQVVDVAVESARETLISRITRLRMTYDGGAGPSRVFWKSQREGADPRWQEFGRKEDFYGLRGRQHAGRAAAALLGGQRGARAALAPGARGPHRPARGPRGVAAAALDRPLPRHHRGPRAIPCRLVGAPAPRRIVGTFADQSGAFDRHRAALPTDLAAFADPLGDRLSAERKQRYERLIAAAPRRLERYRSHRDLTIVHGDAHFGNTMLPRRGGGDVRLIDWDAWRVDTATDDLAYMLAVHCYPDWRGRYE